MQQDTRYKIQDTRYKIQDTRYKIQDTRYKIQDTRYKIQDTRYKIQDTRYKIQDTLKHVLIIGFITTLLCTTVTCGSEGNSGTVDITQADVDRLQSNWQQTLDDLNDGVLLPNNTYSFELFLNELYTGSITSTENLTISLTSSTNGITISPSNATLPFNEALDFSWTQMLTIAETVEGSTSYSLTVSLSSSALEKTFTFNLDFFIFETIETIERLEITQADVDNFGNMVKDLLETASGNFIQPGNSFTLTLSLSSLYRGDSLTSSIPLTISFISLHTDVTVSPASYETTLADLNSDTLEWTITYSEESSSDMTYNIDIFIMSASLSSTPSTTLDIPSPIDAIFDLGVGISPSLSLAGIEHVPVLVLSNIPRRSEFTYTLEQADDATFSSVTTTTLAYSDIDETTFEYILNDSLTSLDWGSTLTDHQFYRLSVYDSNNRFLTGGNTSDITETVLSTFVGNVSAVGDGSESNPYQISNVYQLQEMGTTPKLNKSFVLVSDIDATETKDWVDAAGFNPIDACVGSSCNTAEFFKGSLDGRGYTIRNLTINRSNIPAIGLFGAVAGTSSQTVSIKNITLSVAIINATATQNTSINSSNQFATGSFVGYMDNYTELENLVVDTFSSLSSSSSSPPLSSGGLVGRMDRGSLTSSISYSILSSFSSSSPLSSGGLVGRMDRRGSLTSSISYSILSSSFSSPLDSGGLVGYMGGGFISSSISYSTLSSSSSSNLSSGGLVGRMQEGSLTSNISYSILSSYTPGELNSGGLLGRIRGRGTFIVGTEYRGSLSSSISYSILSSSSSSSFLYIGGLVGRHERSTSLDSNIGVAHYWSIQTFGVSSDLGSLIGVQRINTFNNSYIDTSFLFLNNDGTFLVDPSTSELPLIGDNSSSVNCIAAFAYSETLSTTSGDAGACSDTDLFYNFATYDSNDTDTEPDWNISDSTFYPRTATMPSVFNISKLATQDEYRLMASHTLIRFYDGVPKDESGSDDIVDNASNLLFITHRPVAVTSVDDLEEAYYELKSNNIYISQGLDASLLTTDNTFYTSSAVASTKFTYSFALARYRTSTSSNSLNVNGTTLTINQDTTGTYISGIASLSLDDDFYVEVTVNSSTSVTATGNNTSFSRRYRFKNDNRPPSNNSTPPYLSQITFTDRGNSSNVVYDNDTQATSIDLTDNISADSDVTLTFSDAVTGQSGYSIIFSNTITCSGGFYGESVARFVNTVTVAIERSYNFCTPGGGGVAEQTITIPAGAFRSSDGTPLPKIIMTFNVQ